MHYLRAREYSNNESNGVSFDPVFESNSRCSEVRIFLRYFSNFLKRQLYPNKDKIGRKSTASFHPCGYSVDIKHENLSSGAGYVI